LSIAADLNCGVGEVKAYPLAVDAPLSDRPEAQSG